MNPTRPSPEEKRLQVLNPLGQTTQESYDVNVIIIPDAEPQQYTSSSLGHLVFNRTTKTQVILFEYTISQIAESIWESLAKASCELLTSVQNEGERFQLSSRPLIFIAHSLGGIVLKQFIALVTEQIYDPATRPLQVALAGAVFLGVPHPTYSHRQQWSRLSLILRACTTLNKKALIQAEVDAYLVANVSNRFEEAVGINVPVISAYELRKTNVKKGWFRSQKLLLVDRSFADTGVKSEKLVAVDADHYSIGDLRYAITVSEAIGALVNKAALQRPRAEKTLPNLVYRQKPNEDWADTSSNASVPLHLDPNPTPHSFPPNVTPEPTKAPSTRLILQAQAFLMEKKAPEMPCHVRQPHSQNPFFYGQDDTLNKLDNALLPPHPTSKSSSLRSCTLYGLGGMGKTQIAIEFAFSREQHFDAILWVQADEISKLAESFNRFARALGIIGPGDVGDRLASRNAVLEWLSSPTKVTASGDTGEQALGQSNAKWLLIFDNADNLELLHGYWPFGAQGSILVTSRDPMAKTDFTSDIGIELLELCPQDSAILLQKLIGYEHISQDDADALALSRRLGGLPLAINQTAALIRRREMTINEFMTVYGKEPSLLELKKGQPMDQQDRDRHTLSTVWKIEDFSLSALSLLGLLSILDPDRVGETILATNVPDFVGPHFPRTKPTYIEARTELTKSSLVKRHIKTNHLSLHRLVQEVTQDHMTSVQIREHFMLAVELLFYAWPDQYDAMSLDNDAWEASDEVVAHIVKLQHVYERHRQWEIQLSAKRHFVGLLQSAGWQVSSSIGQILLMTVDRYLNERSEYDSAEPMLLLALEVCEGHEDEMSDLLANSLFGLAKFGSWTNMDPRKIYDFSVRQLNVCRKMDNGSSRAKSNIAAGYSNLGMACMLIGQHAQAIEHCITSEALDWEDPENIAGKGWPHFARIYRAWALSGLGQDEQAADLLEETLKWRERTYGENDVQSVKLGLTLQVLGYIRAKQGRKEQSFEAYQKALANFRGTVGNTYLGTGETCLKLAEYHASNSQPESASVYFEQALKIFKKDSYHQPEVARTLFKQAQFHEALGNDDGAEEMYAEAKAIYHKLVGMLKDDRSLTISDYDNIVLYWSR